LLSISSSIRFTIGKIASITTYVWVGFCKNQSSFADKIHFIDGHFEQQKRNVAFMETVWLKTFYFGVPITKEYHSTDNAITLDTIWYSCELLTDVISWYHNNEKIYYWIYWEQFFFNTHYCFYGQSIAIGAVLVAVVYMADIFQGAHFNRRWQ